MRFMLTFYADAGEWMALPPAEREAAIAEIGRWFGKHARTGTIEGAAVEVAKTWPAGGLVEVRPLAE